MKTAYGYWEPADDAQFAAMGRLAIMADGMGGYEGGQIASRAAVEVFTESYAASSDPDPQQRLLDALNRRAPAAFSRRPRQIRSLHSMGTTCTALALVDDRLYFVHVGTAGYICFGIGSFEALTHDHTLIARLLENGLIRPDQAQDHPQKNVLTSALGVGG